MAVRLGPRGSFVLLSMVATFLLFVLSPRLTGATMFGKSVPTVALTSSLNPSYVGQTVTLTATVTVPMGDPIPTGNVNFMDGSTLLETVPLDGAAQAVHVDTTFISANHALRAEYAGDGATAAGTSPVLNQLVYRNIPIVTGVSAPNPSMVGQPVTVTATVEGAAGTPVPTGNVSFAADNVPVGVVALDGAGHASFVTSALAAGPHTISVTYPGGIVFQGGITNIAHSVDKNASEVSVVSSNNPSLVGQPVTLTATVRGSAVGAPPGTGTVVFKEANAVLSTSSLDANGQAAFTTSSFAAGSHTITVEYAGDGYYLEGTSTPLVQNVDLAGASVALVSSVNPSTYAEAVTFTATATGSSVTPTGNMTFRDGATVLGVANLNGAGVASYSTAALGPGSHAIAVEYGGDGVYAPGATGMVTQIVDRAATTTALTVSTTSTTTETSITWTATVTSGAAGAIGGSVTFNEGLAVIGTGTVGAGGIATTSALLGAGTHTVTATFGGDTNYEDSTSSPVTTVVTAPEGGVDAGADVTSDAGGPIDAADAGGTDGATPPSDGGRVDADAGSTIDASTDAPRVEAGPDGVEDGLAPPVDVARDVPVTTPDASSDDASPPLPDVRLDIASDGMASGDVGTDAARDGGGDVPIEGGGCGCRVGARSGSRFGWGAGVALVMVASLRRSRRKQRHAPTNETRKPKAATPAAHRR